MFSNTASYFIKATLLSASFLTIQNATGMEEKMEETVASKALNPDAKEWQPNQHSVTSASHENDEITESPSDSSFLFDWPYTLQDTLQDGFSIFPLSSGVAQNYPSPIFHDASLSLGLLSDTSHWGVPFNKDAHTESKHSLVAQVHTETCFFNEDVIAMRSMIRSYFDHASLQDGNQVIYYKNALALATLLNEKEFMIQAYISLGNAGDGQDHGVTHYKKALDLLGELGNQAAKAQIHMSIAVVLSEF